MNASRLVSLAAALVINAIVLEAFSSLTPHAQAVQPSAVPADAASPDAALPEIVVTARRPS
jgi:hypothetical protein